MRIFRSLNKAGLNAFFFLMIAMVLLAWRFPSYGTAGSPLPLESVAHYGISFIFFFYGLRLSPQKLLTGLTKIRLHLVIQATTFILFPLAAIVCYQLFGSARYEAWWLGVFYLAALPSTVSSSVVMISIAGGNLSAGIFNASISSIIGIFITPLWMKLFVQQSAGSIDFTTVVLSLCLQVLVPLIAGLLLHARLGHFTERYKTALQRFDQGIILVIIYRAFAESFNNKMFEGFTVREIAALTGLMLTAFLLMVFVMSAVANLLKFSREDRITILFCGSKKSLVQGAAMGQVIFTNPVMLGLVLLPLMIYHALQLLAGSIMAQRFAKK